MADYTFSGDVALQVSVGATLVVQYPVVLYASTYIPSGGAATTAQLTPPAGMSTADFTAGVILDDTNPTASLTVNLDGYTELEWALQAGDLSSGSSWKFRVLQSGTAISSATIPQLTVSGAASSSSIVGALTVPITVGAGMAANFHESISGSIAVPVIISAVFGSAANYTIAGDVTVPISISSVSVVTYHESIAGAVTVPIGIAGTLQANYHETIAGAVTVPISIASTMSSSSGSALIGAVTIPISVAAAMDYTLHASITGAIPVSVGVAATMVSGAGNSISGTITVPISIASTLAATFHESISGSVTIPITVAAGLSQGAGNLIGGSVAVTITISGTLDATIIRTIAGSIAVSVVPAATMSGNANPSIVGAVTVTAVPGSTFSPTLHHVLNGSLSVPIAVGSAMFYIDADTLFTEQVFTDLIGTGPVTTGHLLLRPLRPWVVYNGVITRPAPVRLRISGGQVYEQDGVTTASIPPSYIASGVSEPLVIFPENNYYKVEVVVQGRTYAKGYLKVPFNPVSSGVNWYQYTADYEKQTYVSSGRFALDGVKVYTDTTERNIDISNVLEGTIVYTTSDGKYWGRGKTGYSAVEYP